MQDSGPARTNSFALLAPAGVLLLLLAFSWWPLARYWGSDPQYAYGWLVPPLALILGWRRLNDRPAAKPSSTLGRVLAITAALAFLPYWLLLQPSPDWRLLLWLGTGASVVFLLALAAMFGGKRWARHFAFPAFFLLCAVPWPLGIEWATTQVLMRFSASSSAVILDIFGIPAAAHGNLVEIAAGTVGVDVACSGIRSLQPSLTMALFIGEMFRLRLGRRGVLFVAAGVIAFLTNTGRIFLLAIAAHAWGLPSIDRWHDSTGFTAMTLCFLLIWPVSLALDQGAPPNLGTDHKPALRWPRIISALPLWIMTCIVATEWWFNSGPTAISKPWTFRAPEHARPVKLDTAAAEMLKNETSHAWEWTTPNGVASLFYDLRWPLGPARERLLVAMHRPDICLPAVGWQLTADRGVQSFVIAEDSLPFQAYEFRSKRGSLFVYYALLRSGVPMPVSDASVQSACATAVAQRRRSFDQQLLELALQGCGSAKEADKMAAQILTNYLEKTPRNPL